MSISQLPAMWSQSGGVVHMDRAARLTLLDVVQERACGASTTYRGLRIANLAEVETSGKRACPLCILEYRARARMAARLGGSPSADDGRPA